MRAERQTDRQEKQMDKQTYRHFDYSISSTYLGAE